MLVTACVDLDVTDPNAPDRARALSDPVALVAAAYESPNLWWRAATRWDYGMLIQSAADALTTNTCYGRFVNQEPREPYTNVSQGCDYMWRPWNDLHGAATESADVLSAIERGVLDGDPLLKEQALAAALFTSAATHASLAFVWDSAFTITRSVEASAPARLASYLAVRDTALQLWDSLIAVTEEKSWQLPAAHLPLMSGAPTAARLNRIARTMAARTLVLSARTAAENAATDWTRVLAYAEGGITAPGEEDFDFAVAYDGQGWYDYIKLYGNMSSWMQVDQRLMHRMAPNIPPRFAGLALQPVPEPQDARLALAQLPCGSNPLPCSDGIAADYVYTGYVYGDPGRGVYMQSPFWHRRYSDVSYLVPDLVRLGQAMPHVLAAENDLMIAEALVRTGSDLTRAAALVNKTRVGRGNLPPVAATPSALLEAIDYERDVELLNTSALALFDRRRVDGLQPGQFRHFPVPARELEALGQAVYTFGGVGQPDM